MNKMENPEKNREKRELDNWSKIERKWGDDLPFFAIFAKSLEFSHERPLLDATQKLFNPESPFKNKTDFSKRIRLIMEPLREELEGRESPSDERQNLEDLEDFGKYLLQQTVLMHRKGFFEEHKKVQELKETIEENPGYGDFLVLCQEVPEIKNLVDFLVLSSNLRQEDESKTENKTENKTEKGIKNKDILERVGGLSAEILKNFLNNLETRLREEAEKFPEKEEPGKEEPGKEGTEERVSSLEKPAQQIEKVVKELFQKEVEIEKDTAKLEDLIPRFKELQPKLEPLKKEFETVFFDYEHFNFELEEILKGDFVRLPKKKKLGDYNLTEEAQQIIWDSFAGNEKTFPIYDPLDFEDLKKLEEEIKVINTMKMISHIGKRKFASKTTKIIKAKDELDDLLKNICTPERMREYILKNKGTVPDDEELKNFFNQSNLAIQDADSKIESFRKLMNEFLFQLFIDEYNGIRAIRLRLEEIPPSSVGSQFKKKISENLQRALDMIEQYLKDKLGIIKIDAERGLNLTDNFDPDEYVGTPDEDAASYPQTKGQIIDIQEVGFKRRDGGVVSPMRVTTAK
ncbi:MAG: hypothetical protein GF335_02415 [Candidatus Moranbacteria bacterium]|nr:hypothetical protein [Candidatus Moranbacteria bacterium]